jgi:enterochelin esterase-like enzyme
MAAVSQILGVSLFPIQLARHLSLAWLLIVAASAHAAVDTVTIFSPSNNRNLTFRVYRPPGYSTNTTQHYPVVVSLHGISGTGQQRANTYFPTLDARMTGGEILPMIWIFPDGQTNSFYGDAFDGHKQVYSHIINEALPYADANYRTIPDRDHRAMEGFSMGGFGAAMYTAKHPELFSAVVEQGGALFTWQDLVQTNHAVADEMYAVNENNFRPYSLWDLTTANAAAIRSEINYKMIVGDADFLEDTNEEFRDFLISLDIDPQYQVLPGVAHESGAYLSEGTGLRFLNDHFASVFQREGDYDRDGDTDAADNNAWRSAFGATTQSWADGNQNNVVDAADYVVWRKLASSTSSLGANRTPVPEPTSSAILILAATSLCVWRTRTTRQVSKTH